MTTSAQRDKPTITDAEIDSIAEAFAVELAVTMRRELHQEAPSGMSMRELWGDRDWVAKMGLGAVLYDLAEMASSHWSRQDRDALPAAAKLAFVWWHLGGKRRKR